MISLKERYQELIALTQLYLHREYSPKDTTLASPPVFRYFEQKAKLHPKSQPALITPVLPPFAPPAAQKSEPAPILKTTTSPVPVLKTAASSASVQPKPAEPIALRPDDTSKAIIPEGFKKKGLSLEIPASLPAYQIDESMRSLVQAQAPTLPILENIPDDTQARALRYAWQKENSIPAIIILSFNQTEQQLAFIKTMAKGISERLAPARVLSASKIEAEKKWDKLVGSSEIRLIIASDYEFFLQPGLQPYYRTDQQKGKHYLGNKPLLLLSDLNLYMQQPPLKLVLWQAICTEFAASNLEPIHE